MKTTRGDKERGREGGKGGGPIWSLLEGEREGGREGGRAGGRAYLVLLRIGKDYPVVAKEASERLGYPSIHKVCAGTSDQD